MQFIVQNIWLILGVVIVVVVGSAWWLMTSGYLHRALDWLRPDSDKHIQAKMFCEDKNIRDRKLRIDTYSITLEKKRSSFLLVHDLLCTNAGTGKRFLALSERDSFPIDFNNKLDKHKRERYPDSRRVYIDTAHDIECNANTEAVHNMMGMSLSIIAMAGALVFIIIAIIIFWGSRG